LFAIVSAFDAAYGAYADFQAMMERYWCLRWLEQNGVARARAIVLRDELLRLEQLPLVVRVPGLPALPRGRCVELDLLGHDLLDLELHARLHRVLDTDSGAVIDDDDALADPGPAASQSVSAAPESVSQRAAARPRRPASR
jgi:exoribonuclease II